MDEKRSLLAGLGLGLGMLAGGLSGHYAPEISELKPRKNLLRKHVISKLPDSVRTGLGALAGGGWGAYLASRLGASNKRGKKKPESKEEKG